MRPPRGQAYRAPAVLFAAGLVALYLAALGTGFLNDDYLFLEQARGRHLLDWIGRLDALGNYWRPLSRQVYFEVLGTIAGGSPAVFHAVNFALFLASLALLADLLAAFAPPVGVFAGVAWFALLPMQRVNLTWISCSQDLMALAGTLGALALWRRDRRRLAWLAWIGAIASKESALAFPLALLAWEQWIERRVWGKALRRLVPFALGGLAWALLNLRVRGPAAGHLPVRFEWQGLAATYAHLVQSLLGLEHPPGFARALLDHPPAPVPLVLIAAAAWWIAWRAGASYSPADETAGASDSPGAAREPRGTVRAALGFSLAWLGAFGLVTWPVAHTWSGYYYTLAAAGAALPIALAARRLDRWALAALCAALLWWNAAGTGTRAFAIADRPWVWTSHLTTFYFTRVASITGTLSQRLREREPSPPRDTRFFFATLPPWAGFQMGNGPLIRSLYRDPSLGSYFYSQFSESTAGDRPCRFYYWDGAALQPLYGSARDPLFQVGCDLLLVDNPDGACHAFRRALAEGGRREDNLYWLGWAELWAGRRPDAEAAWREFGAVDDTAGYSRRYLAVREALYERRDTLAAQRLLLETIRCGIGLPNPHAILGELLWARGGEQARYGLLELKIASWLNPRDVLATRELIAGLAATRLDTQARAALAGLREIDPMWATDTLMHQVEQTLDRRRGAGEVATFE